MATSKTKGTNAKIKELKGIKPEKVTDEQLKKIQDTVNSINRTQMEMMHQVAGLRDELTVLQGEFEKEYGTFDINIQDGMINYPKENGEADS